MQERVIHMSYLGCDTGDGTAEKPILSDRKLMEMIVSGGDCNISVIKHCKPTKMFEFQFNFKRKS